MPPRNGCFSSSYSASSSSSSSSSSSPQLSSLRSFPNGFLQNLVSPRLSTHTISFVNSDKAMNCEDYRSTPLKHSQSQRPKSSGELRTEIAELESEILHLERYLLSLYRATFSDHLPEVTEANSLCLKTPPPSTDRISHDGSDTFTTRFRNCRPSSVSETSVPCRRSLSASFKPYSEKGAVKRTESGHRNLADLLGVPHMIEDLNLDLDLDPPDRLSEEIVRRMCIIYCEFSDKTQIPRPKSSCHGRSEATGEEFHVVVCKLSFDEDSSKSLESMLRSFRSLVRKLEKVDPGAMTREQKLAFWINIHNALMMHAYIAFGTSERTAEKILLKAAYNVGGECISAYRIQSSVLGIRSIQSAPTAFFKGRKPKTCNSMHAYALDYPEPLVHFALSSGTQTDPMVHVYTAKGIFRELERARDEFIRMNIRVEPERRILLPKPLYNYTKDASLDMAGLLDTVFGCLPDAERKAVRRIVKGRHGRWVRWLSRDSSFRYVIHGELARPKTGI